MDKNLLKKLAQTKDRFDDIMKLRKAGKQDSSKYDEIFQNYGQLAYNIAVPNKHRKAEIKHLMKEGRFEDIYRKHGSEAYTKNISKMRATDVYNETKSRTKSITNRIRNVVRTKIAPVFLSTLLLAPPTVGVTSEMGNKAIIEENKITYSEELERYNARISEYKNEVNAMNLTDTQIFMKVMSDMWSEIDGYGENDNDILGFLRLNLQEDGKGVCRNFADDVTAKLNAINPEYNARNLNVYIENNEYILANIDRKIVESNDTVMSSEQEEQNKQQNLDFASKVTKLLGNHTVTVVDIPGKNVSLVLDPTNPSIGVFLDGKVHMFSTPDGKGIYPTKLGNFFGDGIESVFDLEITEMKSFLPTEQSLEELEAIYGTEAQNEALEYLSTLKQEKSNETMQLSKSFDDEIRVKNPEILHRIEDVSKVANEKQSNQTNQIEKEESVER